LKDTVLTYCKYLLFGAALLPFTAIAWVLFPIVSRPWWIGVFLPILFLLVWGGAILLKRLLLRFSERHPKPQAIEADAAIPLQELPGQESNRLEELQNSWQRGVETLRASHLKKEGKNPLYVLPWYLVMGESGSGKSTAIKSARLSSPFAGAESGGCGTRNCDWRFYDQGILLDTAGRYAVPVDPDRDNEEWRKFISLLLKYRKKEPLNGLIVALAADRLVKDPSQELENYGRQLRSRIDELMLALGVSFPVYLLITKCDLIRGMTRFSASLPEQSLDQPMGLVNKEMSTDVPAFLETFWASIAERLKSLRLLLLHGPQSRPASAGLLLFPDEMRKLRPALDAFMHAAFAQNHYQETPLLRGIYLSSGRQQGLACSTLLDDFDSIDENEVGPGPDRGLFLHDFFEKVLPRDRGLLAPTARARKWRSITANLGLICWVLMGALLCGLLSFSFMKNMSVIREASALITKAPELQGDLTEDVAAMDGMRRTILNVERRNQHWWIPRFGLNRSRQIEEVLKGRYCREFRDRYLVFFDRNMAAAIGGFSPATPDQVFGSYVVHLSRRTNLVKGRLNGERIDALCARQLPDYLVPMLRKTEEASAVSFGTLYLNYIAWQADRNQLGNELLQLQFLLKQAFLMKGINLAWLVQFTDWQETGAAISLQEFWGGSRQLPTEPTIAPAFTRRGKERVAALMQEVCAAYPEPGVLEREKANFETWYRNACFSAWQRFAGELPKGEQRLVAPKEWRYAAANMAGEQGPYFGFMKRAAAELEPFGSADTFPPWLSQLYRFQLLKSGGPATGVASSATDQGKKIADKLGRLIGKEGTAIAGISGAEMTRQYLGAVAQIAPVARSRDLAHQMALQAFSEAPETGKSPLFRAADAAQRLSAFLAPTQTDDIFSRLISGPVTFYGTFVRMETACSLQTQWEEKVLKEVQGANDPQTLQYLLGKEGPVWKFVGAFADPFIGWSPGRGYYSKSALGGAVPFKPEFYAFLAKGAKAKIAAAAPPKSNYHVIIKGLPTDANREAQIKPQSTRLELQCATGSQVIANMNYPVSKPFIWSPDACGDVLFQIDIGDAVLTKRYTGAQAFPDFLRDFSGGRRIFYPKQFPREKQALERMGVRFIRVNYQMFGAQEIFSGQTNPLPSRVPAKITECWD